MLCCCYYQFRHNNLGVSRGGSLVVLESSIKASKWTSFVKLEIDYSHRITSKSMHKAYYPAGNHDTTLNMLHVKLS